MSSPSASASGSRARSRSRSTSRPRSGAGDGTVASSQADTTTSLHDHPIPSPDHAQSNIATHTVPEHPSTATTTTTTNNRPPAFTSPAQEAAVPSSSSSSSRPFADRQATTAATAASATITQQDPQETRQDRLGRPWYRPPRRGYRAPTRYMISMMTTANILAAGYSPSRLSELAAVSPLSHQSLTALSHQAYANNNSAGISASANNAHGGATAATTSVDTGLSNPLTRESLPAYIYRAATYIIRIPFREMIGGGDRPYDPTAEAIYPDIPLHAYRHTPSANILASPPADHGWLRRQWWYWQEYVRQLRRGTRGKSRSVVMAIKLSWLLTLLYTLVMAVALILDKDENCIVLKVFLGVFVLHKFIVSLYTMDRALYRLPLDLVEHDPDIDDEQANGVAVYLSPLFSWHGVVLFLFALCYIYPIGYGQWTDRAPATTIAAVVFSVTGFLPFYLLLFIGSITFVVLLGFYMIFICIYWPIEKYGLIRRRIISRRNGGYRSEGIVNTLDLNELERALENTAGAGFSDGKQIAITGTIAAIPVIIYRKPITRDVGEKNLRNSNNASVVSIPVPPPVAALPWTTNPKKPNENPSTLASESDNVSNGSNSSKEQPLRRTHKKLNSNEKRDQVIVQMDIDEEALNIPGQETRLAPTQSVAVDHISQQQLQQKHQHNASQASIPPLSPPLPVALSDHEHSSDYSSTTPCAPFTTMFASTSSSSVSVATGPSMNEKVAELLPPPPMPGSSTGATEASSNSTPVAISRNSSRSNLSQSISHQSSRISMSGSGVLAQIHSAGEITAAAEPQQQQQQSPLHQQDEIESCIGLPTECAVCLFDFEDGETLRRLRCDHYFHRDCVDRWLVKHPLCPTCRTSI